MILNQKPKLIRTLLVDDEANACKNLKNLIQKHWNHQIEVSAIALNTKEAERLINDIQPDAIFLDIEMRGENAFQFLERIKPFSFEIIFVTAYDEYALRALKLSAVDYILKPISTEELDFAIQKLVEKLSLSKITKELIAENTYNTLGVQYLQNSSPDRIVLKSQSTVQVILFKDIYYIEAKRSYSCFHFSGSHEQSSILTSKPIADYIELLPSNLFYRIHKSYIVNCNYIKKLSQEDDQHTAILKDGTNLPLSRRRYIALQEFLQRYNIEY